MITDGITSHWVQRWQRAPGAVVVIDHESGQVLTGADMVVTTAGVAAGIAGLGIEFGDRVILSANPCAATAVAFVALLRLGAVVVPVNTAATPREIAHVVQVSGARLALGDAVERFDTLVDATLMSTLSSNPAVGPIALDTSTADDLAVFCFTSGTTGAPKGAPLTHRNVIAGTQALVECWKWTADDVLVSALPMFHVHGLLVALAGSLMAGSTIVVHSGFNADAVIDSASGASLLFGVPTMWAKLVETGRLSQCSGLRLAVSGSAPLSPALFERIELALGQAPVERYGMTETLILTSTPVDGPRIAGTVGQPLPGMQVRLADDGVVEVSGDSVFGGYLVAGPDEPPLRTGFTDDGWFRTGDIGEWFEGNLRLVGRASELIITGGYNVYPREVEDVLRRDAAIADIAVIGMPDETWGEVVTGFVVCSEPDAQIDRWNALCEAELAPYKRVRTWHVVTELPRNAMGKVLRDELRRSVL
jgi:malonyl-CoA/methylmalonyl-CoA synthetase